MTTSTRAKIMQARQETLNLLNQALSYSYDLQKPAQIDYYRAHLDYLGALLTGWNAKVPKANCAEWNLTRCTLRERAK